MYREWPDLSTLTAIVKRRVMRSARNYWKAIELQAVELVSAFRNIAIMHRFSDLAVTGAQGSQEERVARGLLSDAETRVMFGQPHGEVEATRDLLGLSTTEAELLPTLDGGLALWKEGQRSFLAEHRLGRNRGRASRHRRPNEHLNDPFLRVTRAHCPSASK